MSTYDVITIEPRPIIYVSRSSKEDPDEIGQAMGTGFAKLGAFAAERGIAIIGQPLSIYHGFNNGIATFDAAMPISAEQAAEAEGEGDVKIGATPGGKAITTIHKGPYAKLGDTYKALMAFMEEKGFKPSAPCYEVYVDDPTTVPENEIRTEIFWPVA